jgi:hypothetical protein
MANITLNAPSGYVGSRVIAADGFSYAVAAGVVTLPQAVASPLYAAGFSNAAAGTGGATGATGSTGATGATG